jgi:NAD(P)-dependent dehydrogenase (short-subunit alcohol dehydrogenase family)
MVSTTELDGRVALVTGAANGIAAATARAFHQAGCSVVAVDIDSDGLGRLAEELAGRERVETVTADVTTPEGAEYAVSRAMARFGRLDIVANVVGGSRPGKTATQLLPDEWQRLLDFNLTSTFLMAHFAIPQMEAGGGGSIVNVSSGAGLTGMPRNPAYCAAKAGVVGLTKALAIDHAAAGIRVNCVAPGAVLTPLMRRNRSQAEIDQMGKLSLLGRIADPEELAAVIVFLAGPGASYITGETISVSAGGATRTV